MHEDIERLIEIAAKSDTISERQREIIRNKAIALGEDPEEAEMILDLTVKKNANSQLDVIDEEFDNSPIESTIPNDPIEELDDAFSEKPKTLYRKMDGKVLCGVCAGIAERYSISPLTVRLIFFFTYAISLWVYIIMAFVVPKDTNIQ
jgi:phage shock protein PspC (stress-responsive transcriptional regulator)